MSMVMLLIEGKTLPLEIGAHATEQLEALGVTSVTVLEGTTGTAFVLEGWAFDARFAFEAARACLADGGDERVSVLEQRLHVSIGAAGGGGSR